MHMSRGLPSEQQSRPHQPIIHNTAVCLLSMTWLLAPKNLGRDTSMHISPYNSGVCRVRLHVQA